MIENPESIKGTRNRVAAILNDFPATRNSDKLLLWRYMLHIEGLEGFYEYAHSDCPSEATISRCRRKLQSEGYFLSDKQIKKGREQQEVVFSAVFGKDGDL